MDQLEKIKQFLSDMRDLLAKGADENLDSKIHAKMRAEMDRRSIGGKEIADHYRDIDESIPAKQRSNMKTAIANQNKPKLSVVKKEFDTEEQHAFVSKPSGSEQLYHIHADGHRITDKPMSLKAITTKHGPVQRLEASGHKLVPLNKAETVEISKNGQWKIEKSNYGPKGMGAYSTVDNIKRKASRTGEEHEHIGQNKGVRQYTTSGSSTNAAREAAEAKRQAEANKKAPVRTLADMSDEEKKELEDRYKTNIKRASEDGGLKKGADVAKEALTTGNLPIMSGSHQQPTDQEMFGHLVKSEQEIKAAEKAWEQSFAKGFDKLKAPIDKLNKSDVGKREWKPGKSFNSMLTEEELAERNKDATDR